MDIEEYIENHTTPEDEALRQLRRHTNLTTTFPRQLSGPVQGKLLEMLSRMIAPKNILEIGTFTGYSAYCLAKGLQDGGMLHTIEVKDEMEEPLLSFFEKSGIADCVTLHIGDAVDVVKDMDVVFSSEIQYSDYFKLAYPSAKHILIDPPRINVPISATKLRNMDINLASKWL